MRNAGSRSAPKKNPAINAPPAALHAEAVTSLFTVFVINTSTTVFESMSDSRPKAAVSIA